MLDTNDKMPCPECGNTELSVVDTRQRGSVFRKRKCGNGHNFTTIEVPYEEYKKLKRVVPLPDLDMIASAVRSLTNRLDNVQITEKE